MRQERFLCMASAALSISLCIAASTPSTLKEAVDSISAGAAFETVDHLAAEEFSGRLTGTEGYRRAVDWIVSEVEKTGLQPLSEYPDFRQAFAFEMGTVEEAELELLPREETVEARTLEYFEDYMPLLQSPAGECETEVVFAGYGIVAPEKGRDDFASVDVEGKVALVVRGQPEEGDWTGYVGVKDRVRNAKERGAAAIFFIGGSVLSTTGPYPEGIMVAMVNGETADVLLEGSGLKTDELKRLLRKGGTVGFATGNRVRFTVKATSPTERQGMNALALLPGSDPAVADEYMVIGAHLDHVGDWPVLCPGADDNASGSAALLEAARAASKLAPRPRRSILFVWFGGEEVGLLGARHLADNLPESLGKCIGVYNMDMVGAGTGFWVSAGKNYPELLEPLEAARDEVQPGMRIRSGRAHGEMRADHGPFMEAGIPAVSIFGSGGDHHGYHTGEDTVWWVTPKTIEAAARTVLYAAVTLADRERDQPEKEKNLPPIHADERRWDKALF